MPEISNRKLESYKRAELLCRELRWQMAKTSQLDQNKLFDMLLDWLKFTGKIRYEKPD